MQDRWPELDERALGSSKKVFQVAVDGFGHHGFCGEALVKLECFGLVGVLRHRSVEVGDDIPGSAWTADRSRDVGGGFGLKISDWGRDNRSF
ncbi:MAG: hypothetical protein ACOYOF_02880 [Verrucomicrobiaceae bacterium]